MRSETNTQSHLFKSSSLISQIDPPPYTYFDFSQSSIPGLYKSNPEHLYLELSDLHFIARAKVSFTLSELNHQVNLTNFQEFSLNYYCTVYIYESDDIFTVKIPNNNSYNPAGQLEYLSTPQFNFSIKFSSVLLKAAICGASLEGIKHLKNAIKSLPSYKENKFLNDYIFIQVVCSCYSKTHPPSLPEYLCGCIMSQKLTPSVHTKGYLEGYLMFIKGETMETTLPTEYLPITLGESPQDGSPNKESRKRSTPILKYLPELVQDFNYIESGCSYLEMHEEVESFAEEFENSIEKCVECINM